MKVGNISLNEISTLKINNNTINTQPFKIAIFSIERIIRAVRTTYLVQIYGLLLTTRGGDCLNIPTDRRTRYTHSYRDAKTHLKTFLKKSQFGGEGGLLSRKLGRPGYR